ncbi:MAG: sulfatase-like hydrolase/transferase [Planctomycetota bacterium]
MSVTINSRRNFLKAMGFGAAVTAVSGVGGCLDSVISRGAGKARPNFIAMMVDDCSAKEFSCYGNKEIKTPNIDRLGQTGIQFDTCWATPICSPTRSLIMTGRYGFRTRWFHNSMKPGKGQPYSNLPEYNLTFAQMLKKNGYATAVTGKWQLHATQEEHGFDEKCMWNNHPDDIFDGPVEGPDASLPGRCARYWHPSIKKNGVQLKTGPDDFGPDIFTDFVIDFAGRHKNKPFLVYYPMVLTHLSWDFDINEQGYLPMPEIDENGKKTGKKTGRTLKANVEYLDHLVGRIAGAVEEMGIAENTVIIMTTDNGTAGYGKGKLTQERGPRVPLVVNCPGLVEPIGKSSVMVSLADIFPTMMDMADIKLPKDYIINGVSFAPILQGQTSKIRQYLFSWYAEKRFLRDESWLLDGEGKFWYCGNRRDEKGYKDVTNSNEPEVIKARKRFEEELRQYPTITPDDPMIARYREIIAKRRKHQARIHKLKRKTDK